MSAYRRAADNKTNAVTLTAGVQAGAAVACRRPQSILSLPSLPAHLPGPYQACHLACLLTFQVSKERKTDPTHRSLLISLRQDDISKTAAHEHLYKAYMICFGPLTLIGRTVH